MPKNIFQRPTSVTRNHAVPRHGAPIPQPRKAGRKTEQPPLAASTPLPSLEALLKATKH
ncbi:MAG TPA: hypothetical protein VIL88_01560 [Devosia sp.]|jgi:hypothetical protein|uniref:hypothetical protein n=1 Tax=Devosia sp. TaxID=1871048 RepID=UPI002F950135